LALRLLFIVDPLESLKAYKDSSVAMMRAAQLRGHSVWAAEPSHLHWSKGRVSAQATRLSLADNDEDWYRAHENE
jgi:glutathione synthase